MNTNSDPILRINKLSFSYTSRPWGIFGKKIVKPVLNNVNLEIAAGEIVGLAGSSGCGKTTLAKCIFGVLDYEGEIALNGHICKKALSARERRVRAQNVQAVFQDPAASLNPVKNIGWILEEPLRAHKLGSAAERRLQVEKMLDTIGLDSAYIKRKPNELSSGQKQRVAIGAALMLEPRLIVADEPVSSLDVSIAAQILNLFSDLREQKKAQGFGVFFISHSMETLNYLCDRIVVMKDGRIFTPSSSSNIEQLDS
jgi:ABC-type glutathione transport system ATPase component